MADPSTHQPRIFISHAHEDNNIARNIAAALRSIGADVWYDETSLRAASSFYPIVGREIEQRDTFIVLLSPEAVASKWVRTEIDAAFHLLVNDPGRRLVPVIVSPCEVPPLLSTFMLLDLTRQPFDSIINDLFQFLNRRSGEALPSAPSFALTGPPANAQQSSGEPTPFPRFEDREELQFTAFHPKEVTVARWHTLLVYAHIEAALAAIRHDASRFTDELGPNPRESHGQSSSHLLRGTEITLVPRMDHVEFNPARASFTWTEDWHRHSFRFRPSPDLAGRAANGEVAVYATTGAGPLLIALIRLAMLFEETQPVPLAADARTHDSAETTTGHFKQVFLSYCREDLDVVYPICAAYKTLDITPVIDVDTFKSGQHYREHIPRLIELSECFQLLWSSHSAHSDAVREEWQHALDLSRGEGFIRPVWWEEPMEPPPPELAHIHFAALRPPLLPS